MKPEYFSVDVLMERVPLQSRWADERWQPLAVTPVGEGAATPGAPECVCDGPEGTTWRFPRMNIEMHASEAEGLFLNLTSTTPAVFVMWRMHDEGGVPPATSG